MKNLLLPILALVFALFSTGTPSARGQGADAGAGTYKTFVGGQPFGTESYTSRTSADGSRRTEAEVSFAALKFKAVSVFGPDNRPLSFELETGGAKALAEEFTASGVKVRAPRPAR